MVAALPAQDDVETAYLKDRYQAEFREAFQQALAGLSSEQRNYLRLHFVDGLSTRQIAALFQVNQSTAARWLAAARQALFDATRRLLRERLPLTDSDFAGLARVVYSQMDVSITSYLRAPSVNAV
jgi:RNA polymerase sigma-70 factor (ECF subfamily)